MAESNPAAAAEHARRREVIERNPYVLELEPGVYVASHQLVVRGPIGDDATRARLADLGYRVLSELGESVDRPEQDGAPKVRLTEARRSALGVIEKDLGLTFIEGRQETAREARKTLRDAGVRADYVPLLTLAPYNSGAFGYPTPATDPPPLQRRIGFGSQGVTIAVLDTGLPSQRTNWHPGNAVVAAINDLDVPDPLYEAGPGAPNLDETAHAGHGLFVSAIASRLTPNQVSIDSYRSTEFILSNATVFWGPLVSTLEISIDLIVAAFHNMANHLVFNLSFGGYISTAIDIDVLSLVMQFVTVVRPGTVFCAAAGNKADFDPGPDYNEGTRAVYPAAYSVDLELLENVVSVGAIDGMSHTIARFSGRGPWVRAWADGVAIDSEYVVGEWTTDTGAENFVNPPPPIATWSGTSFATPFVAAAIARRCVATGRTPVEIWRQFSSSLPSGLSWVDQYRAVRVEPGVVVR
jgi:subtilisin family serine protease